MSRGEACFSCFFFYKLLFYSLNKKEPKLLYFPWQTKTSREVFLSVIISTTTATTIRCRTIIVLQPPSAVRAIDKFVVHVRCVNSAQKNSCFSNKARARRRIVHKASNVRASNVLVVRCTANGRPAG